MFGLGRRKNRVATDDEAAAALKRELEDIRSGRKVVDTTALDTELDSIRAQRDRALRTAWAVNVVAHELDEAGLTTLDSPTLDNTLTSAHFHITVGHHRLRVTVEEVE